MTVPKQDIEALAARGFRDPAWFAKFFLSDWFPDEMPPVHLGLFAILTRKCEFLLDYGDEAVEWIIANFVYEETPDDPNTRLVPIFFRTPEGLGMELGKFTLVMMPRGFSKTTISNAVDIWFIVYQETRIEVKLSAAGPHAQQQLANVTQQLTGNKLIKLVFGDLKPEQRSGESNQRWSESLGIVQTSTGISIVSRGRGAQVRGLNIDGKRPDRMTFDDIEDEESVNTEEQRDKTRTWFFGDAIPALPELDPSATAVVLGTLRHFDALLTVLARDSEWTVIKFGALDRKGAPIWPAMMDEAKIEDKKQHYASRGLLHVFYLEYFNEVRAPEKQKFKPEYIHVVASTPEMLPYRAMASDPAISAKRGAAYAAIVGVGMDDRGSIEVLECWGKVGATPREQIDAYFDMHFKLLPPDGGVLLHGVEAIAFQAALVHLIQEEMFRKAKTHGTSAYFEIIPITHSRTDRSKEERVEGILQPRYAARYIRHARHFPLLEGQLLDWPNGKRDFPDALAMAVSLLDDFAGLAGSEDVMIKDEYPPLDEVFGGDWRQF